MKSIALLVDKIEPAQAKVLRAKKRLPGVIYGRGIKEQSIIVSADYQEFKKVFLQAGESTIVELILGDKKIPTLIHRIQTDPVLDNFIHIDFYAVDMDQEIQTHVQIKLKGEAPAVKLAGGVLVHNRDVIEIKCLPKDLISHIEVDISILETLHSSVTVADIKLSDKIKVLDNPNTVIASISTAKVKETEESSTEEKIEEGKANKEDKDKKTEKTEEKVKK